MLTFFLEREGITSLLEGVLRLEDLLSIGGNHGLFRLDLDHSLSKVILVCEGAARATRLS